MFDEVGGGAPGFAGDGGGDGRAAVLEGDGRGEGARVEGAALDDATGEGGGMLHTNASSHFALTTRSIRITYFICERRWIFRRTSSMRAAASSV